MCLVSAGIPTKIRQAFMEQVVYQYWDSYNPPKAGYRAAYLHQLTPEDSLFGWLYNDEMDDLGRTHLPYFVCYYLEGSLQTVQLENILTCLHTGPVAQIDRQTPPTTLENIVIPDLCSYQPVRMGVTIASGVREQSHIALKQRTLLGLYVPVNEHEIIPELNEQSNVPTGKTLKGRQPVVELREVKNQAMTTGKIQELLKELASKPIGIQSAVLVSLEGQPMTIPIGMDENGVLILAGTMLYLARSIHEELNWNEIENISVRGQEGHIILTRCNPDVFLLIKAGKALAGLLEGEINRTVKKLQAELNITQANKMKMVEVPEPEVNSPPELNAEVSFDGDNEIRYRGRRLGS